MHLNILAIAIKLTIALDMYMMLVWSIIYLLLHEAWTLVIVMCTITLTEYGSHHAG